MSQRYDLRHERGKARCVWCWSEIKETEAHTAVSPLRPPYFGEPLRFHHRCWAIYQGLSGIEGEETRAIYRQWRPERLEALRLHAGLTLQQFAAKVGIGKERLMKYLRGHGQLGFKVIAEVRSLAIETRFEQDTDIDWSDRRACYSLCMHLGWNCGELARRLGVKDNTIARWWDKGVPKESLRYRARLNIIARQNNFDAGMLVDDHLWTPELLHKAIEGSGQSQFTWAMMGKTTGTTLREALIAKRRINRAMAHAFTRAATRLGVSLPPQGYIAPKQRKPRPFPKPADPRNNSRTWTPEELAWVGRAPDEVVARHLETRSVIAVRNLRRKMRLPLILKTQWSGQWLPPPIPLEELVARYQDRFAPGSFAAIEDVGARIAAVDRAQLEGV